MRKLTSGSHFWTVFGASDQLTVQFLLVVQNCLYEQGFYSSYSSFSRSTDPPMSLEKSHYRFDPGWIRFDSLRSHNLSDLSNLRDCARGCTIRSMTVLHWKRSSDGQAFKKPFQTFDNLQHSYKRLPRRRVLF